MDNLTAFDAHMSEKGWASFERRVPDEELAGMRADILASVADCGRRQVAAGIGAEPDGTAHHVVGQYAHLDAFLAALHLDAQISRFFGGAPYILHAFNPVTVGPSRSTYLHNIHRDVRTHAGSFRMLINMLVMVDPFTLENGATYMLSGSHRNPNTPDEALFHQDAERLVGPAGTIVLFDSNLWHAAGQNVSDRPRVALTLSFSRAFVKQQMDYPRFLGAAYGAKLSPRMRQMLGYNSMTPTSYEEWYRPREQRLYRADQG